MSEFLRRRMVIGFAAGLWSGLAILSVPNPGWMATIVTPFLFGLLFANIARSWWAAALLPIAYLLGAAIGRLLFWPDTQLSAAMLVLAAANFAIGIALTTGVLTLRRRVSQMS